MSNYYKHFYNIHEFYKGKLNTQIIGKTSESDEYIVRKQYH